MRTKCRLLLVALLLAGVAGCSGKMVQETEEAVAEPAWKKPYDTSLIPANCYSVAIIHPQRIAQSPAIAGTTEMAEFEKGPAFRRLVEQWRVDPRDLEQVTFLEMVEPVDPSRDMWDTYSAIVLRWEKPFDRKELLRRWCKGDKWQEDTHAGKTYFWAPLDDIGWKASVGEAFYIPDDRTMIVCTSQTPLKVVLSSLGKKGPMSEHLSGLSLDHDAVLAFATEATISSAYRSARHLAEIAPANLSDVRNLAEYLKAATLSLDLFDSNALQLVLYGNSELAAAKMHAMSPAAHELLKSKYPALRKQLAPLLADMPEQLRQSVLAIADQIVEGLRVTANGDQVEVLVRTKEAPARAGLLPAISRMLSNASDSDREREHRSRFHNVCIGMLSIEACTAKLPAAASRNSRGEPLLSWRVHMLPYIDCQDLYDQFHRGEPWDSEHNRKLLAKMPREYRSDPRDGVPEEHTTMMLFVGDGTPFDSEKELRTENIKDKASNTIMLVDAGPDKAVPWTKPQDLPFDPANPIAALGRIFDRGFIAATFDGSVHRLSKDIPAATLKALITHDGGEPVDWSQIEPPSDRAKNDVKRPGD